MDKKLTDAAVCLVQDLEMLRDGTWTPDAHTTQNSLDNAQLIAEELPKMIYPTYQERNTILAALRHYQNALINRSITGEIADIATNDGRDVPLTEVEVDELCERINQ